MPPSGAAGWFSVARSAGPGPRRATRPRSAGRRCCEGRGRRREIVDELAVVVEERADHRQRLRSSSASVIGVLRDRLLQVRPGDRRRRRRRSRRGRRTSAPGSRLRARPRRPTARGPGRSGRTACLGLARLRITRSSRGSSGCSSADRLVQVGAAAGERVAELGQVALDRLAGSVSKVLRSWSILDRARASPRSTGIVPPSGIALIARAAVDLEVLEAERGARRG